MNETLPLCERDTVPEIPIDIHLDDADIEVLGEREEGDEAFLSAPYNWCDYDCERCPLEPTCKVAALEKRFLASAPEAAKASTPPTPRGDRMSLSVKIARPVVTSIEGRRLVRLARLVVLRLSETARGGHLPESVAVYAIRLAAKSTRITGEGYAPSPAEAARSIVPGDLFANIMHLEGVVASLDRELARLPTQVKLPGVDAARTALEEYRRLFAGWVALVPADFRARIAGMVAEGTAPSPFATRKA